MKRKEKIIQAAALFVIELMILLPVYVAAQAAPNQTTNITIPTGTATITATAPLWVNKNYVDVQGKTMPNAKLEYFIGPTKVKIGHSLEDGSFQTKDVPLIKKGKNDLIIKASTDTQTAETKLEVNVDTTPPILNISEIPSFTTSKTITVRGDVSEEVRINYTSYTIKNTIPPEQITGLEARQVLKNQVTLLWNPAKDLDFLEYAVYRDGKRIATTKTPTLTDTTVASGKTYRYSVSAVDDSCNEGEKSGPVVAKTQEGGITNETTANVELSCKPQYKHLDTVMPFNLTFDLSPDGKTIIEIIAQDRAGNKAEIKKEISYDAGAPQFLWTNLDQLGTTYIPDITIKGNLSEKATVFVYINGKVTDFYKVTDDNGYFEIKITLKSDVEIQAGQAAALNTGVGWQNNISLKAVDLANRESWYPAQSQTIPVIWAQCGFGSWVTFTPDTIIPSIVTPRLLLQGVQQAGIPFKIKYVGGQKEASIGVINVIPIRMSPDLETWFDNDKISAPQVFPLVETSPGSKEWTGYIQFSFTKFPLEKLELKPNATETDKEMAISKWRQGEVIPKAGLQEKGIKGFYIVPGCPSAFGCLRFYFEIDIPVMEKIITREPYTTQEKTEVVNRRQRACLPVTVEIDQVIPPDVIPEGMLKSTSKFLQNTITAIDKLLDPLTQVTEYLFYSCAASAALMFLAKIAETIGCSIALSRTAATKEIAKAGLCEVYTNNTSEGQQASSACGRCRWFISTYNSIKETVYQPICDRVGCPSAPTLQKYLKDSRNDAVDLTVEIEKGKTGKAIDDSSYKAAVNKYGVNNKLWGGNSCAFSEFNTQKELQVISTGYYTSNSSSLQKPGIKQVYENYAKPDKEYEFCNDLTHPAHPYCCGQEYMDEWNSACGIGNLLSGVKTVGINIDTFSEIRQSTGLAAQRAGKAMDYPEYTSIFNFLSGFCSSSGEPTAEMIRTEINFDPPKTYAEDNMLQVFVKPVGPGKAKYGEKFLYEVSAGYLGKKYAIKLNETEGEMEVFAKGSLVAVKIKDFTQYFQDIGSEKEQQQKNAFAKEFVEFCNKLSKSTACTETKAKEIYEQVKEYIGTTDKEYIVKPNSGLWRAVQCICLPAVVGYLEYWKAITIAVKQCFDSIRITGDYSSGICRAVLSRYVCDFLWEIISCFVNIWSKPSGVRARTGAIGEILGAITEAGSEITTEVKGRYGQTSTFNALFNEKKLIHGLCFMAFGLDYSLDIASLTRGAIDASTTDPPPILFEICEKRFLGFNPSTTPRGLTSWEYHFGILAIAAQDSNVKLELKCSTGFNCNTDEYASGECDCNRLGIKEPTTIRPSSDACPGWKDRLAKGEMLNVDCYHMMQTQQYRFDKAILTMEWIDPGTKQPQKTEQECKMNIIGQPPYFCRFDAFSLSFRCIFGDEPSGIRITKIEPVYTKMTPGGVPAFGLYQTMSFRMDIQQMLPEDPAEQDKGTKFIAYEIKNNAGEVVASMHPKNSTMDAKLYELKTNGFYKRDIDITDNIITSLMFSAQKGSTTYALKAESTDNDLLKKLASEKEKYIKDINIKYTKNNQPQPTSNYRYFIKINNTKLEFHLTPIPTPIITENITAKQYVIKYNNITTNEAFEIRFTIDSSMINATKNKQAMFEITPQTTFTTVDPCTTREPVTWTATFTILNADKYGQPTEQKAVDPKTGEIQEKTVAFQAVCLEQEKMVQVGAAAPEAGAAPAPVPAALSISAPVILAKSCPQGYKEKGKFSENEDMWGRSSTGEDVNKTEWLNLCVSYDLIERYGEDVVQLRVANSPDNPCGDSHEFNGWFSNNYNGWAHDEFGDKLGAEHYFHLCVKRDAINQLGRFVYLTKAKEKNLPVITCIKDEKGSYQGIFIFKHGTGRYAVVKQNSGPSSALIELNRGIDNVNSDVWAGLCVKPVIIPPPAPAPAPAALTPTEQKYQLRPGDLALTLDYEGKPELVEIMDIDKNTIKLNSYTAERLRYESINKKDDIIKLIVGDDWPTFSVTGWIFTSTVLGTVNITALPTKSNQKITVQWLTRSDNKELKKESLKIKDFLVAQKISNIKTAIVTEKSTTPT
ncbi:MAG: hypothetical protein QW666_00635 [Candidatus Woesearchaeota archaeon]